MYSPIAASVNVVAVSCGATTSFFWLSLPYSAQRMHPISCSASWNPDVLTTDFAIQMVLSCAAPPPMITIIEKMAGQIPLFIEVEYRYICDSCIVRNVKI